MSNHINQHIIEDFILGLLQEKEAIKIKELIDENKEIAELVNNTKKRLLDYIFTENKR